MARIPKKQFDQWVMEAISMVPKRFLARMKNLAFVVDDRPTRLQIRECEHRRGYWLFGLYQGYNQTSKRDSLVTPDKITIFRSAFLGHYKTKSWMKIQVYKTVWHEIAHHFGSDEEGAIQAEKTMFNRFRRLSPTARKKKKKTVKISKARRGSKRKGKVTFRVK